MKSKVDEKGKGNLGREWGNSFAITKPVAEPRASFLSPGREWAVISGCSMLEGPSARRSGDRGSLILGPFISRDPGDLAAEALALLVPIKWLAPGACDGWTASRDGAN